MPVPFAGTTFEAPPGPRACAGLGFVELAPRLSLPKPATLARWRKKAGDLPSTLVVPRRCWQSDKGPFRDAETMQESLKWIRQAADASGSWGIVVNTGADITLGQRDRGLLEHFVGALRTDSEAEVIWVAGGLWEQEQALPQAVKMGVTCAFDPLEDPPPPGDVAYARVQPMGATPRLGPGHLDQIAATLEVCPAERAYVAVVAEQGAGPARQLQKLLSAG